MAKHRKKLRQGRVVWLVLLGLACLGLLMALLLNGTDVTLLNPKGLVAREQTRLMVFSVALMLTLAIPTILIFYFFAWKYRESNKKATYNPDTRHSKPFLFLLWVIPSVFVLLLVHTMWPAAHRLDQHKQIASDVQPLTIQVVALRWKWLFIYPEQRIATVNFVAVPIDTPIQFDLTADEAPMNSFWIPHWGGQLYAMTGHSNRLNLMADTSGDYTGSAAEINGAGFAGMKFTARASSTDDFDRWVQEVRRSSDVLSDAVYDSLVVPSENNPAAFYVSSESDLYDHVLTKYADTHQHTEAE